jgi:hypothetical protein
VQREVEKLEEVGLLLREPEGNRVFYRLDPGFPLLAELMALFRRAAAAGSSAGAVTADPPPRPEAVSQPFDWLETRAATPLPDRLRKVQVGGEWDRAY